MEVEQKHIDAMKVLFEIENIELLEKISNYFKTKLNYEKSINELLKMINDKEIKKNNL